MTEPKKTPVQKAWEQFLAQQQGWEEDCRASEKESFNRGWEAGIRHIISVFCKCANGTEFEMTERDVEMAHNEYLLGMKL
jgi:hypothetical protein